MNAAIAVSQDAGESGKGGTRSLSAAPAPESMADSVMALATDTADPSAVSAAVDLAGLAVDSAKAAGACSTRAM
ncbi:MAG: hypothetical protein ABSF28_02850 [Terracidiphilus sp.]